MSEEKKELVTLKRDGEEITKEVETRHEAELYLKQQLNKTLGPAAAAIMFGRTPKQWQYKRLMNPTRPAGPKNPEFTYIEQVHVVDALNMICCGDWDLEIVSKERIESANEVFVQVRITLRLPNGKVIVKDGFGGHKYIRNNPNQTWGDVFKSATSKAIKDAARRCGIGADLYRHEEKGDNAAFDANPAGAAPAPRKGARPNNAFTPTQGAEAIVQERSGMSPEEEAAILEQERKESYGNN